MKYLQQFGIILAVSFVGELLNYAIPLSIPASIYGLVLMFVCLCMKWIKLEDVKRNGCIFNRDHAINVYTGGCGTDYFHGTLSVRSCWLMQQLQLYLPFW